MRLAVVLVIAAVGAVSTAALAKSGSEVLDEVRDDARRDAENAVRSKFPYSGSLYGLPGQTRSDSIRESAIRSAIGGLFGSCKKSGALDIGKGGLDLNVGSILANTEIKIPEVKLPTSGGITDLDSLIPKPTEVLGDQVKVGGSWIAAKDYNSMVKESQQAIKDAQAANLPSATPAEVQPKKSGPVAGQAKPAISTIWAPKK